jgi:Fanconi anemia group M protein
MLATIAVSYGIPTLFTKNQKETASLLAAIARREQEETGKNFSHHSEKRTSTLKEQQEYVVSSLPDVGPNLAKELLKKFKTVRKIVNAKEERLKKIKKIGDKKAKKIRSVFDDEYSP